MEPLPSGWSDYIPILTGFARAVLATLGGAGFTWALAVNASQIQMAVSAAMMLAAAGWSAWQKIDALRKAKAAVVTSAAASAQASITQGQPVAVAIAPKVSP